MNRSSLPRKTRNQQIYYAAMQTASKQLSCALSKDLRKKYGKRSARIKEAILQVSLEANLPELMEKLSKYPLQIEA